MNSYYTYNRKEKEYEKKYPFVGNDGIYIPVEEYQPKGESGMFKCIMTKEIFVEAYNKWIKEGDDHAER